PWVGSGMTATGADHRLRVVHVVHDYYPAIGGSERLFQTIAEGLARRGFDSWVVTSTARSIAEFVGNHAEPPILRAGTEEINGVHVKRLPFAKRSPLVRQSLAALSSLWSSRRLPGYGKLKAFWAGPHIRG